MLRLWKAVELLALSLWLGAMVGFGAIVAPLLFSTPGVSRSVAGEIAGRAIARTDLMGVALGILILVGLVLGGRRRPARLWRLVPVIILIGVAATNLTYVRGRLDAIQELMDRPVAELAETDPLRVEYNRWHQISVNLWALNMLVAAGTLVWAGLEQEGNAPGGGPTLIRPGRR